MRMFTITKRWIGVLVCSSLILLLLSVMSITRQESEIRCNLVPLGDYTGPLPPEHERTDPFHPFNDQFRPPPIQITTWAFVRPAVNVLGFTSTYDLYHVGGFTANYDLYRAELIGFPLKWVDHIQFANDCNESVRVYTGFYGIPLIVNGAIAATITGIIYRLFQL